MHLLNEIYTETSSSEEEKKENTITVYYICQFEILQQFQISDRKHHCKPKKPVEISRQMQRKKKVSTILLQAHRFSQKVKDGKRGKKTKSQEKKFQ